MLMLHKILALKLRKLHPIQPFVGLPLKYHVLVDKTIINIVFLSAVFYHYIFI